MHEVHTPSWPSIAHTKSPLLLPAALPTQAARIQQLEALLAQAQPSPLAVQQGAGGAGGEQVSEGKGCGRRAGQ